MRNYIFYGKAASGKTHKLHKIAEDFSGKVFLIDLNNDMLELKDFKKVYIQQLEDQAFLKNFREEKTFLTSMSDPFFIEQSLKNLINFITKLNKDEKVLICIDEVLSLNILGTSKNKRSILVDLIKLNTLFPNISVIFVTQDLKDFKNKYPNDADVIFANTEIECFNPVESFSGELRVRFPKILHKKLVQEAAIQGVSLNSYLNFVLTRGVFDNSLKDNNIYDFLESYDLTLDEIRRLIERFTAINKECKLSVDLFFDWYVKEPKKAYMDEE